MKNKQTTLDDVMGALKKIQAQLDTLQIPNHITTSEFKSFTPDELFIEARAAVVKAGKASTSYIQRKFGIGYSRAANLMDLLEQKGIIGAARGAKSREVVKKK